MVCAASINHLTDSTMSVGLQRVDYIGAVCSFYLRVHRGTLRRIWNRWPTQLTRWTSFTSNEKSTQVFWYSLQTTLTLPAVNCPSERWGWNSASPLSSANSRSTHSGMMLSMIPRSSNTIRWWGRATEDFASFDRRWWLWVLANSSSRGWSHSVQCFLRKK